MIHNEPGAPLPRHVGPHPLQEDADSKAGLRQKLEMYSGPGQPCEESAYANLAALEHGKSFADDGHVAFIEVSKRPGLWFAGHMPVDQISGVTSLLNRHLRYTR